MTAGQTAQVLMSYPWYGRQQAPLLARRGVVFPGDFMGEEREREMGGGVEMEMER